MTGIFVSLLALGGSLSVIARQHQELQYLQAKLELLTGADLHVALLNQAQ